ncbi:MAG TPA: glycosyltransferase family 2 protein [Solirubrobacteraceae bacterium]|jgi:GT2 family glycosyltransferase
MRASIIIVTYGQRAVTERCLESLRASLGHRLGRDWELVLVDNDSPDDTPALLQSWSDVATVRLLGENRNFSGGCNAGAEAASGEVLVFLNNDTEVPPGALETLVEQACEPGIAIAGARLLYPNGTLQHAGVAFFDNHELNAPMPHHIFLGQDGELPAVRASYELDCVSAACMAVRASAFHGVGGFDTGFRNGLEGVDLCLKIRVNGGRIVYRGDVVVVHHEGRSRGQGAERWATPERQAAMALNAARLVGRWAGSLEQDDEFAARIWDAELERGAPRRSVAGASVALIGQLSGIGPAAAEARGLLAGLSELGCGVAAADLPPTRVRARLTEPLASVLATARRREIASCRWTIHIPSGACDAWPIGRAALIRVGSARTALPVADASEVWASCPAVARDLMQSGLDPSRVRVLAPTIRLPAHGTGGAGILAILPTHDSGAAQAVIDALRSTAGATPVRLLPTVRTRGLETEIAERLTGVELLDPCSDEQRFAELAASADVVLAADPSDHYERRALVAAATGAALLTTNPDGPAASVLGAGIARSPEDLPAALAALTVEPGDRSERAGRVAESCGPHALASHLTGPVASASPAQA